jgi:hypothetical protein
MGRTCSRKGQQKKNVCRMLIGKLKGKRPLERSGWAENIEVSAGVI